MISALKQGEKMNIELIDKDDNDRLESLSLELDKSKGTIALELCEFFFRIRCTPPRPSQKTTE